MSAVRITLGKRPYDMTVVLSPGTDFICALRRKDETDWPVGVTAELKFLLTPTPTLWSPTVSGSIMQFDEDETDVDALLALIPKKARLYYIDGSDRILWGAGSVVVER